MKHKKKKQISKEQLSWYSKQLKPKVDSITANLGYKFLDLTFVNENQINYLRITISHPEHHVSLDDCEIVSRKIEKILDQENLIPFPYMLEVQSPGSNKENLNLYEHSFELKDLNLVVKS